MNQIKKTVMVGDKELTFEVGKIAKQAGGSTVMHFGDSTVLCTVCTAKEPRPGMDFLPLTVVYPQGYLGGGGQAEPHKGHFNKRIWRV